MCSHWDVDFLYSSASSIDASCASSIDLDFSSSSFDSIIELVLPNFRLRFCWNRNTADLEAF